MMYYDSPRALCPKHCATLPIKPRLLETSVRAPGNANFLRISLAGCFHELGRIYFILKITPAQIFIVCLLELGAIAGRSTDVGSNTDVAARNERSDLRAPVIHMLAGWPAVRQCQGRIAAVSFQIKRDPH